MKEKNENSERGQGSVAGETTPLNDDPASQLPRRDFLHVGMLGIAAASYVGVDPVIAGPGPPPPGPTPSGPTPPAPGGGGPKPPLQEQDVPAVQSSDPETWNEPWVWRPSDWPGQQLELNVVENQNPGVAVGLGNPGSVLFSYGGNTPGPTIRMKDDETLFVKLRNLLGLDFGDTYVGPYPNVPRGQAVPAAERPYWAGILTAAEAKAKSLGNYRADFCLGEHANGVHSIRVTNLHTHGLHVRPSRNPNGTHSDNVILRLLSQADYRRREREGGVASCEFMLDPEELYFLRDDEAAGEANYEFRLGDVQRKKRRLENELRVRQGLPVLAPQPHPAGTFWYHPHAHGATHNQVASGMAGFLLVEGDIERSINRVLVDWQDGELQPDPTIKTGPYDYRERLMLIQRALNLSQDKDARKRQTGLQQGFTALVNGGSTPTLIKMRPGAIERWRVLNGSVDGRGYKRFMVVKGQYTVRSVPVEGQNQPKLETLEVNPDGTLSGDPITLKNLEALEATKQDLYQLSIDGVTLVRQDGEGARYFIKDLSRQGTDSNGNPRPNPLWSYDPRCEAALRSQLDDRSNPRISDGADVMCRLTNVWRSPDNVRNCFVRPNEFYMGPANRTDLFFKAPTTLSRSRPGDDRRYEVYTVFAKTTVVHADTPQFGAQNEILNKQPGAPSPEDVIVAYVLVEPLTEAEREEQGLEPIRQSDMKQLMADLETALPPVQDYLQPVADDELRATAEEARARSDVGEGDYRTRRILYSGWGHPSMPLVSTYPLGLTDPPTPNDPPTARAFVDFINNDPMVPINGQPQRKHENLIYAESPTAQGFYVLLPPELRTMAISFNNARVEEERGNALHPDDPQYLHPEGPRKFNPTDPYRARMLEDTAEEWTLYNLTNTLWGDTRPEANPPTQYASHYVSHPISRQEGQQRFLADQNFQLVGRGIDHPFHVHQNPFWVTRLEIPDETGELVNILDEPRWMDSTWIPRNRGRVVMRMRFPDFVGAYVHHCHILLHEDNGMMHVIEATPFANASNYLPQAVLDVDRNSPRPSRDESYTASNMFYDSDAATGQLYPGFTVTPPPRP